LRNLPAVILWAVAFAFVEAAVVEYLRALYSPSSHGGFSFPIMTVAQLRYLGWEHERRLLIEIGREFCTLVMLASVAAAVGRNRREAWAYFLVAFGVWDIFYYLWLRLLVAWPLSLMTWDLLFLIPVPWVSPVLAPVLISLAMCGSGIVVLWCERRGRPLHATWTDWAVVTGGGLTVIVSFCWDYRSIMAGGQPQPFLWPLFFVGLGTASIRFLLICRRSGRPETAP
jgi:hypothetical protein